MAKQKEDKTLVIIIIIALFLLGATFVGYTAYLQSKGVSAFDHTTNGK